MSFDWGVYSDKILQHIDLKKNDLFEEVFTPIKEFIDNNIYWCLEEMLPIMDLSKDDFTLRLGWHCSIDLNDDRNILFNLKEKIKDYDGGDLKRLDRLKIIFKNSIQIIEERITELEQDWTRD